MVVSVSRRCDIPRFRFDWFLEKLDAGFVEVTNPFNSRQTRRVSLLPADAEVLAFWTRDPTAILRHTEDLERRGYRFYVMITLTAYPAILEPNVPPAGAVIETMKMLAEKIGAARVIWRYDPVFLSNITDYEFHRRNFATLATLLKGTVRRVIVSVYDEYSGAEKRLAALEQNPPPLSSALKRLPHYETGPEGKTRLHPAVRELLGDLARIARGEGMEIQTCAEEDPAYPSQSGDYPQSGSCGIQPGACIDGKLITEIFGIKAPGKDRNQRPGCRCVQSVDIGTYGPCPAGCVYCYAR